MNNQINPIELNNIRVLSTTYEKLLCVVSQEQAEILRSQELEVKEQDSEEYGKSYLIAIKCASDKMCNLYKTIKRSDIVKGTYDIVGNVATWEYGSKSGLRLDGYFITKVEPVLTANPALLALTSPTPVVVAPVFPTDSRVKEIAMRTEGKRKANATK